MKERIMDTTGRPSSVSFRLTKDEQEALREAAEKRGETVSNFLRRVTLTEAGVRRQAAVASSLTAPTRTATIGAMLSYTEGSPRLVASPLLPPSTGAVIGAPVSSPATRDFSQRALDGVRGFVSRYEND